MAAPLIVRRGCAVVVAALLVAPALVAAPKHRKKSGTQISVAAASITGAPVGDSASLTLSVEQITDASGATPISIDVNFTDTDDVETGSGLGVLGCTDVALGGFSTGRQGEMSVYVGNQPGCYCFGPACSGFISLTFTPDKGGWRLTREGSERGTAEDGTRVNRRYRETEEGADVQGFVFGNPITGTGQLSTFRGDPELR